MTPAERITALMTRIPVLPGVTPTDFTVFDLDGTEDWVNTIGMDRYVGTENTLFYNPNWVHEATDQQIIYALAFHTVVRSLGMTENPEGVEEGRWNAAVNFFVNDFLARNCVASEPLDMLLSAEYRNMTVEEIYHDLESKYA